MRQEDSVEMVLEKGEQGSYLLSRREKDVENKHFLPEGDSWLFGTSTLQNSASAKA